jgi:hypothetical protein
MTAVWAKSPMKGSALLLELAIADFANDDGQAFPSVATLQRKTRMSERRTRRLLRDLEEASEMRTEMGGGPHGVNLYVILPGGAKIAPLPFSQGSPRVPRGGNNVQKGGAPAPPKPSVPINEPEDELLRRGREVAAAWLARQRATG